MLHRSGCYGRHYKAVSMAIETTQQGLPLAKTTLRRHYKAVSMAIETMPPRHDVPATPVDTTKPHRWLLKP